MYQKTDNERRLPCGIDKTLRTLCSTQQINKITNKLSKRHRYPSADGAVLKEEIGKRMDGHQERQGSPIVTSLCGDIDIRYEYRDRRR